MPRTRPDDPRYRLDLTDLGVLSAAGLEPHFDGGAVFFVETVPAGQPRKCWGNYVFTTRLHRVEGEMPANSLDVSQVIAACVEKRRVRT